MRAYAKINLCLDVLDKRPDGYHNISSIMQTVSLFDRLEISLGGSGWSLECSDKALPTDGNNLALAAAVAYMDAIGSNRGGRIFIQKGIPALAGLGGGSSDGAAVLSELNRLCGNALSKEGLSALALSLGSDLPFFLTGGTALVCGMGEEVTAVSPMPGCHIVISKPPFGLETGKMYKALDQRGIEHRPSIDAMLKALDDHSLAGVAESLSNVFEPLATELHPSLAKLRQTMTELGALGVSMTGKGPSMFAIFQNQGEAETALDELCKTYPQTFLVNPV